MDRSLVKAQLVERGWTPEGADFLLDRANHPSIAILLRRLGHAVKSIYERRPENKVPIPDHVRWAVWERDDFTCKHCGARRYLTIDHIVPESKGGTLDMSNLQTLCRRCNSRKGTK